MNLDQLRAYSGFKLTPRQCGPNDDAFFGFLSFAFGGIPEAIEITKKFVAARGECGPLVEADIPNEAGRFIDWLIVNVWGEEDATTTKKAVSHV